MQGPEFESQTPHLFTLKKVNSSHGQKKMIIVLVALFFERICACGIYVQVYAKKKII